MALTLPMQETKSQKKANLQLIVVLILLLTSCLMPHATLNASPLHLNGLASYNNLTKHYYLAALYLPQLESDEKKVLSLNQHKQMKLLVTAHQWSPRIWSKQWRNNIAINNDIPSGVLQKKLDEFTNALKGDLLAGDLILVNYEPVTGTQIFINQQLILASNDMALFNTLLTTWIGNLPPSRNFKHRILSLATDEQAFDDTLKLHHNNMSEKRINTIKHWLLTLSQITNIENSKRQESLRLQLIKARQQAQKKVKAEQRLQLKRTKKVQADELIITEKLRKAEHLAANIKRDNQIKYDKLRKEKESVLENTYYTNLYAWQLRKAIRDKITYPAWAREFNQEAVIDVFFTINAKGNVIGIEANEEKSPKLLIGEVIKSIESTSGQVHPPSQLKGSQWTVSVNHNFSLRSKNQTLLIQPTKPTHLI
jgi:hypothetical protein